MTLTIEDVKTALAAEIAKTDALIVLTDSIKTALDTALAGGIGITQADLQSLVDSVNAESAKIDAAIAADTPASIPTPTPEPAPTPTETPPADTPPTI